MRNKNNIAFYIAFIIWPFGTLLYALKNYRKSVSRILFVLSISFLGFTTQSFGDLERYEKWFYIHQNQDLADLIISYFNFGLSDIYTTTLSILVGFVFNSHHFYFAFLYGIFAYLLSGVILKFIHYLPQKINNTTFLLLIGFALFYTIRSIISVRFYTGGLFYLLMMFNYIESNKYKYLFYSIIVPLFHFGLGLLIFISPLLILVRKKYWLAMGIVVFSLAIGQSSVINLLEQVGKSNEGTYLENRVNIYATEEGRMRLEKRYQQGALYANWKLRSFNITKNILWYYAIGGICLLFYYRKILQKNKLFSDIFIFILLLFAASNIMLNISNGNRYIFLYIFMTIGLILLLFANIKLPKLLRAYVIGLIPLTLAYGLMALYASNQMFTLEFFATNFIVAIFEI